MDLPNTFHSQRKVNLLNDIDKLRAQGVSQFVDLPQLIVCGDQSSGKSSVLEAISGIPFPTKDNLCTRFATEVTLRNNAEPSISVSILPDPEKDAEDRNKISQFHYDLSSFETFPSLVESALERMEEATGRQAFFQDILQVKVAGPQQPHLTIVDLPGLIHSQNKQQTVEDVKVVKSMISRYMQRPRSIILAVVSAKNDYANQIVLSLAREFDPEGARTLGVITKPDELRPDSDTEKAFVALAQNLDVEFNLGWHVLRNRDYKEKLSTKTNRDEVERNFFEHGAWRGLPRDTVGIDTLRPKLSDVLFNQIKNQLPSLVRDIEIQIGLCHDTLARLGPPRKTLQEQKRFLISLSQEFQHIVRDALSGTYRHDFFQGSYTDAGAPRRLRAAIQNANLEFAGTMRLKGQARKIVNDNEEVLEGTVTKSAYLKEVQHLMRSTRGRELPGMGNPLLVGELFHRQSKPWANIIGHHSSAIWRAVKIFLESVVSYLCSGVTSEGLLSQLIDPLLEGRRKRMDNKIEEILRPYHSGHPITYNHYFTDTIQKFRSSHDRYHAMLKMLGAVAQAEPLKQKIKVDVKVLNAVLSTKTEPDMDLHACTEVIECMKAFYKVAMKSVVDNIAIYAIEECLISELEGLLSPSSIWEMNDELVKSISAEPAHNEHQRETTLRKLNILRKGAATCQVHSTDTKETGALTESMSPFLEFESSSSDEAADDGPDLQEDLVDELDLSSEDEPELQNDPGPSPAYTAVGSPPILIRASQPYKPALAGAVPTTTPIRVSQAAQTPAATSASGAVLAKTFTEEKKEALSPLQSKKASKKGKVAGLGNSNS